MIDIQWLLIILGWAWAFRWGYVMGKDMNKILEKTLDKLHSDYEVVFKLLCSSRKEFFVYVKNKKSGSIIQLRITEKYIIHSNPAEEVLNILSSLDKPADPSAFFVLDKREEHRLPVNDDSATDNGAF